MKECLVLFYFILDASIDVSLLFLVSKAGASSMSIFLISLLDHLIVI